MSTILFNLHDVVLLGIAYQSMLFFFLFAFVVNQSRLSQMTICLFFICTAVIPLDVLILFGAAFREYSIENFPDWFYVFEFGYWLQGPFLFLYCKSLINKEYRLGWGDLIYVMPFILYVSHQIFVYHSQASDVKEGLLRTYDLYNESNSIFFVVFARESLRLYFFLMCFFGLKKHIEGTRIKRSNNEGNLTRWLYYVVIGFSLKTIFSVINSLWIVLNVVKGFNFPVQYIGLISNYFECLFLGGILLYLARNFFPSGEKAKGNEKANERKAIRPDDPTLVELENIMKTERPYLDATLSRERLAERIAVSPRTLSNIVHSGFDCNFFSYINRYRIEEAKMMLVHEDKKDSTVLDIMFEVGFQNKATFNSLFKKMEGVTPSEYKKKHSSDERSLLEQDYVIKN